MEQSYENIQYHKLEGEYQQFLFNLSEESKFFQQQHCKSRDMEILSLQIFRELLQQFQIIKNAFSDNPIHLIKMQQQKKVNSLIDSQKKCSDQIKISPEQGKQRELISQSSEMNKILENQIKTFIKEQNQLLQVKQQEQINHLNTLVLQLENRIDMLNEALISKPLPKQIQISSNFNDIQKEFENEMNRKTQDYSQLIKQKQGEIKIYLENIQQQQEKHLKQFNLNNIKQLEVQWEGIAAKLQDAKNEVAQILSVHQLNIQEAKNNLQLENRDGNENLKHIVEQILQLQNLQDNNDLKLQLKFDNEFKNFYKLFQQQCEQIETLKREIAQFTVRHDSEAVLITEIKKNQVDCLSKIDENHKLVSSQLKLLPQSQNEKEILKQIQCFQTKYDEIKNNLNLVEQKFESKNKNLTEDYQQFIQQKIQEIKQYQEIQIFNLIKEKDQSLQKKFTQIAANQGYLSEKWDENMKQLNMSLISQRQSLEGKQKEIIDTMKQSLLAADTNENVSKLAQQQQEVLEGQIWFLTQIIEKLKKQQLIENDFENLCDVFIPNQTGPIPIIEQLYVNSWKKRHTEPQYLHFVRDEESYSELLKNYSIRDSQIKQKLKEYCTSFRQARGDGNCFYTAFGYQFLLILLLNYDDSQYIAFIKNMKNIKLPMKVNLDQVRFDNPEEELHILNNFFYRLTQLRCINDLKGRKDEFTKQFAAYEYENPMMDGQLYGLSTIFFRNLANYVVEFSEMKEALFDRENLLLWELECNSNEIIIAALAKYLKINVILVYFENNDFKVIQYEENLNYPQIILLIKPGHYNIGIKEQENKMEQIVQITKQEQLYQKQQQEIFQHNNLQSKELRIIVDSIIKPLEEHKISLKRQLASTISLSQFQPEQSEVQKAGGEHF